MRKIIPVVAAGATALTVAGGTFGYAAAQKDVTLSVDGAATTLSTRSSTVGDILDQQGITLGKHDIVAPSAAASISDGTRIAVQYGRRVTVNVDGKPKSVWTTATDVNQALAALGVNTTGAAISTSRSSAIGRQGLAFDVATLKTVKLNAAGQRRVIKTTGRTVAQVLSVAKITVDGDDRLSAKPSSQVTDGSSITYTRVDVKTLTTKKSVPFDTVRKHTASLERGDTSVDHAGKAGKRTLTFVEVRHNGKVVRTEKTGDAVTTKPHSLLILVGTHLAVKKVPVKRIAVKHVVVEKAAVRRAESKQVVRRSEVRSTHRSSSGSSSKPSNSARSSVRTPRVSSGGVWDKIAKCESGGNWSINTGNGFYGGLQFTKSTWRAYGGSGMPNHASRSTQIRVAKRVQASQGWGAWPGCTSKLGIR